MLLTHTLAAAYLTSVLGAQAAADAPRLYLPFDGNADAAISSGAMSPRGGAAGLEFHAGVRDRSAHLTSDCRFPAADLFEVRQGTVAFWLRPGWPDNDPTVRSLFCLYGSPKLKESWLRNRWSLTAGAGELRYWICGAKPEQHFAISAPIRDWQAEQWHHVAITWGNINSGRSDAELALYLDGKLVQSRSNLRLDVGPISDTLDIGRDSDQSPDYAAADYDEFYLYARALTGEEIHRGIERRQSGDQDVAGPVDSGMPRADWWDSRWHFRCRARLAPGEKLGSRTAFRLPLDLQADLQALGLHAAIAPASLRVVPCNADTGQATPNAEPLAVVVQSDGILWQPSAGGTVAQPPAVEVYFNVVEYDTSVPLFARARLVAWGRPARSAQWSAPDYARDTYGAAWDFDKDDDFAGIDVFGNRPEYFRNRQVKNGVLSADVSQDPYFIWGDMWSSGMRTKRQVAIDLKKYPLLEMRVRQSCSQAEWEVMGRADSPQLMQHKFHVVGTDWQTIRIHLVKDAHFGGVLQAFRIDPTSNLDNVHIEIDWIHLTNEVAASREPVELLGEPDRPPTALSLAVESPSARAGSSQKIAVRATDAKGAPVRGQPVTVRMRTKSDGQLQAAVGRPSLALGPQGRRGLTDAEGRLELVHVCSRLAGPQVDTLGAIADGTNVRATPLGVDTLPGPPHHYRVALSGTKHLGGAPREPRAVTVREAQFPLPITVQLVDEHDNPLPVAGRRVELSAADAVLEPSSAATDERGQVAATLRSAPGKRWVYEVAAQDDRGCSGHSGKITVALDAPRTNPIRLLPNGYFASADGRPFVPLGGFYANWVQSETPDGEWSKLQSFTDTTDEQKCRWMAFLQQQGVTTLRFMLRTHHRDGTEPMDVIGRVNQELLAEAVRYLDLARRYELQFQLVLHEDYTKPAYFNRDHFRRYCLPRFAGEDLETLPPEQRRFVRDGDLIAPISVKYTDPDVIACQDRYARELLSVLRTNPQVFAYELENEMVECPASWANHAIATIRDVDPRTPVCVSHGGDGLATADPLWWHRNVRLDFYNYHLYPHYRTTTPDIDYGAAANILTRYGRMCGPSLLGESSGDQFSSHPSVETRRFVMRDLIWMSLCNGNPGVLFWNARGPEIREFKPARDALRQLDLATFQRARPEIGIDVRFTAADDKYFRTPAGVAAYTMLGRYVQHYANQGVDFDMTLEPDKYPLRATLQEFRPPEPTQRPLRPSPGWQLNYLARQDYRELLVYVRNFAGAELWECKLDRQPCRQYLRRRTPAALGISFHLPAGQYQATVYDLDRQQVETRSVAAESELSLGTTDHDFALVLKRR